MRLHRPMDAGFRRGSDKHNTSGIAVFRIRHKVGIEYIGFVAYVRPSAAIVAEGSALAKPLSL
jgi:hypothetical protein